MNLLRLAGACSLLVLLAACGGKVVFVEDGGEGGNGAAGANGPGSGANGSGANGPGSGANGPGPNTTVSMDTVVSSGTGMMNEPCDLLCAQFPECFEGGSCVEQCKGFYVPGCEPQTDAYLLCVLSVLEPGCNFPEDACFNEEQNLQQCQNGGDCFTDRCGVGQTTCFCSGQCSGIPLEQECFIGQGPEPGPPPPLVDCNCFVNGEFIGDCQQNDLVCDLEAGCCKFLLLEG